jgi:predicted DNA-binding transcriptional regulator AlpA
MTQQNDHQPNEGHDSARGLHWDSLAEVVIEALARHWLTKHGLSPDEFLCGRTRMTKHSTATSVAVDTEREHKAGSEITEQLLAKLEERQATLSVQWAAEQCQGPGTLLYSLACLPERTLIDDARLASILQVCSCTIKRMVQRSELPPPIRMSGHPVWFAGTILEHIQKRLEAARKDAERTERRLRSYSP